jgi:hypothetical protein
LVRYVHRIDPYREEDKMLEGLAIVGAVVSSLAAFEVLASRYGRDSRDGNDWFVHRADH